jgi:plastocyanin
MNPEQDPPMTTPRDQMLTSLLTSTLNRRRLLVNAGIAGGSLAAMGTVGAVLAQSTDATPMAGGEMTFESPVDVLNYALTLEHLETAFYRDGLAEIGAEGITALGFQQSVFDSLSAIAEHEAAHVETLTQVITQLGGEPVAEATYDFGYTDAASFLQVAQALEDTGVAAYQGAAQFLIDEDDLLTAALTIHGVEARHAAYLALLNATSPFPEAVNPTLTPAEVLEIAGPFIVDDEIEATPAATSGETAVTIQMLDFAFEPAELEIAAGTTVTWTNVGGQPHTATAEDGSFDTGVLTTDRSASHTFTEPGTYPYVCTLHENTMQAVLVVM